MKPRSDAMAACMAIIVYFARIKNKGFNVLLDSLLGGRHPHTYNYFNCMFQIFLFFQNFMTEAEVKINTSQYTFLSFSNKFFSLGHGVVYSVGYIFSFMKRFWKKLCQTKYTW